MSDMNSRWEYVQEGLKQAGLVFVALLLVGLFAALFVWGSTAGLGATSGLADAIRVAGGLTVAFIVSILAGPVPTLLTLCDTTDNQLLVLSCVLIVPYWVCLGAVAGFLRWKIGFANSEQTQRASLDRNGKYTRWTLGIGALVIAVAFFPAGPIAGPNYVSSGRFSAGFIRNSVINNLRQIDGAKQQFALEKKLSSDYLPTEVDLAPYLLHVTNFFHRSTGPIRYVLNPISKPPYAVLYSDWRFRRRGWKEGFTITNGTLFQLP